MLNEIGDVWVMSNEKQSVVWFLIILLYKFVSSFDGGTLVT